MQNNIKISMNSERSTFLENHYLNSSELKAFNYIAACGSDTFGFNSYRCEDCGHTYIHYNSCGNRHCPSCQCHAREQWIDKFSTFLLDIAYFHIVFTIPDSLNNLFLNNRKKMFNILFKVSSQTLLQASMPHYGQIGFSSILHT